MARRTEVGTLGLGILSAALIGGLVFRHRQTTKSSPFGDGDLHHGLRVPRYFADQSEPGGAGRVRCDLRHLLRGHLGFEP